MPPLGRTREGMLGAGDGGAGGIGLGGVGVGGAGEGPGLQDFLKLRQSESSVCGLQVNLQ